MLDKAKEKTYKKEFIHIKENWLIFLVCFFISRYSIIEEIFPFAIIVLSTYCYNRGPSISMLLVMLLAIFSIQLNFVYSVILIAIYLFFYSFRNEEQKSVLLISVYGAAVLFFSKTAILVFGEFNINSFMLNIFEALFIFSSIALINDGIKIIKEKKYINRKKSITKSKDESSELNRIPKSIMEAASTSVSNDKPFLMKQRRSRSSNKKKKFNLFSDKAKNKIKEQLLWQNMNLKFFEVMSGNGDSIILSLTVKTEKTPEETEAAIVLIVRNLSGIKVKCVERVIASPNYYVLKFKNIKRVKIRTYNAAAIKDGSPVSGDSFAYEGRSDKYYTVLCDGIGSGQEAFDESNVAVDLLSSFINADFSEEQVIKTLNSILMLKFEDERYVTFDLNIIDYSKKEIRLYKAGAAPTYILSGGTLDKIVGKSLPMGILENFDYNVFKRVIRKGDIIVMISDGIVDSVNMDVKKSLEKYLEIIMDKDPQTIANSILSYALRGRKEVMDDMTVLVTIID